MHAGTVLQHCFGGGGGFRVRARTRAHITDGAPRTPSACFCENIGGMWAEDRPHIHSYTHFAHHPPLACTTDIRHTADSVTETSTRTHAHAQKGRRLHIYRRGVFRCGMWPVNRGYLPMSNVVAHSAQTCKYFIRSIYNPFRHILHKRRMG